VEIQKINDNKKQFINLLLLADESESMIDKYLERGDMFALYDNGLKSICVVTKESSDTCELKNIATDEKWHGKGYGSKLIQYISAFYTGKYKTMIVGTGDVPSSKRFYEKNGFSISHRIHNFFTDNYDHPMFEDGVQLVDMIYLKKELQDTCMDLITHPLNTLGNYIYADIVSLYKGKWVFSKHKERTTWETQGGHIEDGETPLETAKRELFEEAGAVDFDIEPLCDYTLTGFFNGRDISGNGQVFFAVIHTLSDIPSYSEMETICFSDSLPNNLTYPILYDLFKIALEKKMKHWLM